MSVFSDCLKRVQIRRGFTTAQIAEICNVEKTVIHRWFCGQRLPNSWEKVEKTMQKLHLSADEWHQLKKAYERSVIGEEQYECYQRIMEILLVLQRETERDVKRKSNIIKDYQIKKTPEFLVLENKLEILQCIQNLLSYLIVHKENKLYVKMQVICPEILMMVKMFCYQNPDNTLEEIIYLDNELDGSGTYNMRLFEEAISLLLLKNPISIFYSETADSDRKFAFNWILSKEFFVQFNDSMSYGMVTTRKEWRDFFLNNFIKIKKDCLSIGKKKVCSAEYIMNMCYEDSDLVSLEFMPCFGKCLTEELLRKFIYMDLPNREALIQEIVRIFVIEGEQYPNKLTTFFLPNGLLKFMEKGRLEIFPEDIYSPLDLSARKEFLRKAIKLSENGTVTQYMLREEKFPNMEGIHIEQVYGKIQKLTVTINFWNEEKEQIEISEQRILNQFWNFFEYLKESEYVYTLEESIQYMKQVLKKCE